MDANKTKASIKDASKSKGQHPQNAAEAVAWARKSGVKIVDYKFTDLLGTMQHISYAADKLKESVFAEGIGFDGSSIRGFQSINESDMLLLPDPATAFIDPALKIPTLSFLCTVKDPVSGKGYLKDPRSIARRAEEYLLKSGIATESWWGPEAEFFVFDSARFDLGQHGSFYELDSVEGIWNTGKDNAGQPNLAYKIRNKEGYFPTPPMDTLQDFRSEAILRMIEAGLDIDLHHHEVATGGQGEIGVGVRTLTSAADQLVLYKYILKNVAREHGKTVTFMPKPLFGDNGTGMHTHQSLWKNGAPLFFDKKGYAGVSQLALWYIGGLLKHAPALCAICNSTTNSYRRLVPGYEAPTNLAYSARNRSAAVRIPMYSNEPKQKRVEYRPPDAASNPYLAFSAMLMAGLDGIRKKIDPGKPYEVDIFELSTNEAREIPQVPGSLDAALQALEDDHAFLLEGGVFTKELIETWIEYKEKKEHDFVRLRPHPAEFHLYYDC
ncbi:MAG TPA: type I glutamate--ammonia ligase [Elusimicrobiota bacterium]|nr:type I glutamate--ammonia ligase [Elusimicrobiota bacterium]